MKLRWKVLSILAVVIILGIGGIGGWLYFYSFDLPATSQLRSFVPSSNSEAQIHDCTSNLHLIRAVPFSDLGKNLTNAVIAAEGRPEARNLLSATLGGLTSGRHVHVGNFYSLQIARTLVCEGRPLRRSINQLRLANQIERQFTNEQILTIYLNTLYLGPDTYGVENASQRYYGKHAFQLSVDEAALIAALIRSPSFFSPILHADRAYQRRNMILDRMVQQGVLQQADAENAKAADLHVRS